MSRTLSGGDAGSAIVVLSLVVNTMLLPFYNRAEAVQKEQHEQELRMAPYVNHIKRVFSGDERQLMLQAYYRQSGYKPYHVLRSSIPLLVQIPFFIAAYHFLSNLKAIKGVSWAFISDLGAPDALLSVGGLSINVLPIAMTLVNVVSSEVYSRGMPAKERAKLHGMSLVFLVLLYNSPSGLVLYWLYNNLYSLFKNLVNASANKSILLYVICSGSGAAFFMLTMIYASMFSIDPSANIAIAAAMQIPIALHYLKPRLAMGKTRLFGGGSDARLFVLGCLVLTVLSGILIPSAVVQSSPAEFTVVADYRSPLACVTDASLVAIGGFILWLGLLYYLSGEKLRYAMCMLVWIACGTSLVNYFLFGTTLGLLNNQLQYENWLTYPTSEILLNHVAMLFAIALLAFAWVRWRRIARIAYPLALAALCCMAVVNVVGIAHADNDVRQSVVRALEGEASFELSTSGKNVIVLMLDRAIGAYIPYLFQEKPELERQFDGFTWYPNTVSFGTTTNVGSAPLFGGYDYAPEKINERFDVPLVDKQNEALKLMPMIFDDAGFEVTVCDPPYAGYNLIPDLSIYDDCPNVHAFTTEQGQFSYETKESSNLKVERWRRNFFCFSIMKMSPILFQPTLYKNGTYHDPDYESNDIALVQIASSISKAEGLNAAFIDSYGALSALPQITKATHAEKNTFLMMANSTTHEPTLLQEPEYIPSAVVDNVDYDAEHGDRFVANNKVMRVETADQMSHYHVNMAALLALGNWFDYLRECGAYDNTRIIIVADHGHSLKQFDDMVFDDARVGDVERFNPLMLVKDFGAKGFSVSGKFMTHADTPTLAMAELVANPVNPFTGNPVTSEDKGSGKLHLLAASKYQVSLHDGCVLPKGTWYSVHDGIFVEENWEKLGER